MSQETYLVALTANQRFEYLQTNAAKIEDGKYVKPLTEEEISAAKDQLTDNCIKLGDLGEEFDKLKKFYKEKMKPMRESNSMILTEIRTRQTIKEGCTYYLPNYPENVMESYNEEGEFLGSRRLRPDERQGNVFQINQAM
jgi:hypothetical protein